MLSPLARYEEKRRHIIKLCIIQFPMQKLDFSDTGPFGVRMNELATDVLNETADFIFVTVLF